MKATLTILAIATLLSISVTQQASPNIKIITETAPTRVESASQATTCPVYVPPAYVEQVADKVSTYHHCTKCNTGVYLPNVDNTIKCTFCGASEAGN